MEDEFELSLQEINARVDKLTIQEQKKLKLWLDKLLENQPDDDIKDIRNEYAHRLETTLLRGRIPAICYKNPPNGKLPPLQQLMKSNRNDDRKVGIEEKLKDFAGTSSLDGEKAYNKAHEEVRKSKVQLDNFLSTWLRDLAVAGREWDEDKMHSYTEMASGMRTYFKQCEKQILDLLPKFNWCDYEKDPYVYYESYSKQIKEMDPIPSEQIEETQDATAEVEDILQPYLLQMK